MIPSIIFREGSQKFLVVGNHTWTCKRDSLGRRIKGNTRPTKFLGWTVSLWDRPETARNFPPMPVRQAVSKFRMVCVA